MRRAPRGNSRPTARRLPSRRRADCRRLRSPRASAFARHPGSAGDRRLRPAAGSAANTGPARGRSSRATGRCRSRRAPRGRPRPPQSAPAVPRALWMRASKGTRLPSAASTDIAPLRIDPASRSSAAKSASSASAVETCVPFRSARPSLGPSTSGSMPAAFSAAPQSCSLPATRTRPSPISASDRCASGARSPEAPTEPWLGTTGCIPAFTSWSSRSITTGRTPENPRARLAAFSTRMSRTVESSSGLPTPAACERMR